MLLTKPNFDCCISGNMYVMFLTCYGYVKLPCSLYLFVLFFMLV